MKTTTHDFHGPFKRSILDNGLTVLLKPMEFSTAISLQVWVECGSLYETDENNGLSHFLEHMLFKGTEKLTGPEINAIAERLGGNQNAATSKDYTTYYVNLPPAHAEEGLELLHQMTFRARLPEDEFRKERNVVLSELARYHDNPSKRLWQEVIPRLYDDHPYHRLTIGDQKVIEQTSYEQLIDYYDQFYVPERTTVVVAGKFTEEIVRELIQERFGSEPHGDHSTGEFSPVREPTLQQPEVITSDVGHVYATLATTGYPVQSKQSLALDLLMQIMGSGQTSRFYENLVLKQQLATSLSGHFWSQRETGPVMIQIQMNPEQVEKLMEGITVQAKQLLIDGITDEEYNRALTQIKTDFIYSTQTASGFANQLGYWEIIHRVEYLEEYMEALESVGKDLLKKTAREIFAERTWISVFLTPQGTSPQVEQHPLPVQESS